MKVGVTRIKKILFATASTTGGGAERMLFNIIRSLDCSHICKLFVTSTETVPPSYVESIDWVNANKVHAIQAFPTLLKELKSFRPDYVFSTSSNVGYMLVLAKIILRANFKIIIRCAVTPSEIYQKDIKSRILNKVISRTYDYTDMLIAQTEFMRNDLIRCYGVHQDKVKVIRNIVDKDFIKSQSVKFTPAELESQNFNIVAVGALYSVKGFDLLIDAISPIMKRNADLMLYILGEERYEIGYKNTLMTMISNAGLFGRIHLLGRRENPYPYFKAADLFVMSSRKEGFPNVVLESLSLKTPVVATDCVDFSGVIEEGVNGYVVRKNDVDSLRSGISTAIDTEFDLGNYELENYDYNLLFC